MSTLRLTKLPVPGRKLSHKHSVIVCPLAGWSLKGFHNKEVSLKETQTKQKKKQPLKAEALWEHERASNSTY